MSINYKSMNNIIEVNGTIAGILKTAKLLGI